MRIVGVAVLALLACASTCLAQEKLPATATKATMDQFKALADGKTVKVTIFDFDVPVTAELVWSWEKKSITGKAFVSGKSFPVNSILEFDGERACAVVGEQTTCHMIYIDGNSFYEVTNEGKIHAASTIAN